MFNDRTPLPWPDGRLGAGWQKYRRSSVPADFAADLLPPGWSQPGVAEQTVPDRAESEAEAAARLRAERTAAIARAQAEEAARRDRARAEESERRERARAEAAAKREEAERVAATRAAAARAAVPPVVQERRAAAALEVRAAAGPTQRDPASSVLLDEERLKRAASGHDPQRTLIGFLGKTCAEAEAAARGGSGVTFEKVRTETTGHHGLCLVAGVRTVKGPLKGASRQ